MKRAGTIAIIGLPNAGKSTLTNLLVGEKVSITSRRIQTTRHCVRGIIARKIHNDDCQFIFIDTPGLEQRGRNTLTPLLRKNLVTTLHSVDIILCVVVAGHWGKEERTLLQILPEQKLTLLVVNKIDLTKNKDMLLPYLQKIAAEHPFLEIFPVSALRKYGMEELLNTLATYLPVGEHSFSEDTYTDQSEKLIAQELIREQLFRALGNEVPQELAVSVVKFTLRGKLRHIEAIIYVKQTSHKLIVIGKEGLRLKKIATNARYEMERAFGGTVWLESRVQIVSSRARHHARLTQSLEQGIQ